MIGESLIYTSSWIQHKKVYTSLYMEIMDMIHANTVHTQKSSSKKKSKRTIFSTIIRLEEYNTHPTPIHCILESPTFYYLFSIFASKQCSLNSEILFVNLYKACNQNVIKKRRKKMKDKYSD